MPMIVPYLHISPVEFRVGPIAVRWDDWPTYRAHPLSVFAVRNGGLSSGQASIESRFVAGSVRSRPFEDHTRIFALNTVKAESRLLGAIDGLLPKLTDSSTRELAGSISRNHRAELARLRRVFAKYIPEAPPG